MTASSGIVASVGDNGTGAIRLSRPAALNALSPPMIAELGKTLLAWREDARVARVILAAEGGKAFSAGADVRAMWEHARAGDSTAVTDYFAAEYRIDLMLATYPKPVLAVVDGICFGAGMGLAVHSRHCAASERASFSMPETLIGFFPDAGATFFLSRLPCHLGTYLGMTGARIGGGDAVRLGLASHFVASDRLEAAAEAFAAEGPAALDAFASEPPPLSLAAHMDAIDDCFGQPNVEAIIDRLKAHDCAWAKETLGVLAGRSPASLRWTLESQTAGRHRSLEDCLRAELDLVAISTAHPDFAEGVRAALVDKDRNPQWSR